MVSKNVKGGPFGPFSTSIQLQNIKKEGGLLQTLKNFRKKSQLKANKPGPAQVGAISKAQK